MENSIWRPQCQLSKVLIILVKRMDVLTERFHKKEDSGVYHNMCIIWVILMTSWDVWFIHGIYLPYLAKYQITAISNQQYNTYNVSWEFLYSTWISNMFKTSQLVRSGQFPSLYMRVSSLCWASTNLSQGRIRSGYKLQIPSFCTVRVFGTSSLCCGRCGLRRPRSRWRLARWLTR